MSSIEIAAETGKRKNNVHRDIKEQILIDLYGLKDGADLHHDKIQGVTVILDNRNYWYEVLLDREHTLTIMTGYDVKARPKRKFSIPQTLSEALLLAGKLAAVKVEALAKISADKSKVDFALAVRHIDAMNVTAKMAESQEF